VCLEYFIIKKLTDQERWGR